MCKSFLYWNGFLWNVNIFCLLNDVFMCWNLQSFCFLKGSITRWKNVVYKIFKTLWRSNSIEFLIHGTNFDFILENKYVNFIWSNSILRKILIFNMWRLSGKNPSCYRHFNVPSWGRQFKCYTRYILKYLANQNSLAFEILHKDTLT